MRVLGLFVLRDALEPRHFGFAPAEFAFERERTCFVLAPAGDGTSVVARAVRHEEITVGIVVRHALGDRGSFDDVGGAQLFQEILRARTQRVAEFNEPVQPRNKISRHRSAALDPVLVERWGGIHEEGRAPSHFLAQQSDAGARLIE